MVNLEHYNTIAELFEYPGIYFSEKINTVQSLLNAKYPEAAEELKPFTEYAAITILNEQQEIYTRTFDVQAITTLDLGYVIFGDDYKRGELLSNLNREHSIAGTVLDNQLADHLPKLLRLLPKIKDEELIEEMISNIISPALNKMIIEFGPERIESKNELYKKHQHTLLETSEKYVVIYYNALKAFQIVLKNDFDIDSSSKPKQVSDFLKSIQNEVEIERLK
ncbi:MAG: hypothetical protein IT280_11935 [Ignavibacteria bacterium]|nr:hypothetical protein [Ignavibacteria bacterium]